MTSGRTLVRGAFLSGAGMILSMAGQLGAAVIFGRVLPESDIGTFWLLILCSDCLVLLTTFGLHSALPRILAAAPEEERRSLGASILLFQVFVSTAICAAVFAAWLLIRDPAAISVNENWTRLFPYLWLLPPFFFVATQRDTALAAMAGMNRFGPRAAAQVWGAFVNVSLVALFIGWLDGGLLTLALCTLTAYTVAAVWLGAFALPKASLRHCARAYVDAVQFSKPLYVNNLMAFTTQRFDTFLVALLLGNPVVVAYYEMAKRLPNMYTRILVSTLVPYLPGISARVAEGDTEGAARLLNKTLALILFLGYTSVLAILVIERPLIVLLFSEKYLPSLTVLWLLMTGTCLAIQSGIFGQSLIALGKPGLVAWANLVSGVFSVTANLALIPRYGIFGAGVAYLCTMAVTAGIQGFWAHRNGMRLQLGRVTMAHAVMAGCLALGQSFPAFGWRAGALIVFVAASFAVSLVSVGQLVHLARLLIPVRSRSGSPRIAND
ncbi:MAG: oligosaccharide flippase family protein [Candidatus Hydrogenedentes bacterium]|nr:oligosaccharide flippase family protein [Candidatus Hydrogenedentota bacterium]